MPLLKNTFQPFFPDPNSPAPKDCVGSYCYPVAAGDIVRQQWYQTPCNASLVVDPDFEDFTLGAEMITNGGFTGNANNWEVNAAGVDSTTCPANVDGWCYNTNQVGHDGTLGLLDSLQQVGIGLVAGNIYRVIWTVQGMTQGTIHVKLGDGAGSSDGTEQFNNGTFTEFIYYEDTDDGIHFVPSADFDGNIDNVSCMLVTMTEWVGPGWIFDGESACVIDSLSTLDRLYNVAPVYLTTGDYYQVTITATVTQGSIAVYVDDGAGGVQTNIQTAITTNGDYTYYLTALQDGTIGIDPSADFLGCITGLTVQKLRNDFTFELINQAGDSVDISDQAEYDENKITLNLDMSAMLEAGTIDYGCFEIFIFDSCLISGENLVQDGTFSNGNFTKWTRNSGAWQYQMTGTELEIIFEPLSDGPTLVTNGDFAGGDTDWGHDGSWTLSPAGAVHTPGSTTPLTQTITATAPTPPFIMRQWWQVVVTGRTAGSFTVTVSDKTSQAYIQNDTITNFFIITVYGSVTLSINPSSTFDGTITLVAVHETVRAWNWNPIVANPANLNVGVGNYQLTYDITSVTGTTAGTQGAAAFIQWPMAPETTIFDVDPGTYTHQQTYTPGNTLISLSGYFLSLNNNIYYPGRVTVDNYHVEQVEPFEATYRSECLNFQQSHAGTKLITAYYDRDALGSTYIDALSFESTGFMLQMRVHCRSLNAYLDKEVNVSKFSNGNGRVTYAQYEKFWQFVTDYLSESALITLGAMANCDHFHIGDSGSTEDTEYLAQVEQFQPQWRAEGDYNLAPATINIRVKEGGMKFNRHT